MVCVHALSQSPKGKDTLLDLPAMLGYTTCEAGSRLSRGIHISGIPCPPPKTWERTRVFDGTGTLRGPRTGALAQGEATVGTQMHQGEER